MHYSTCFVHPQTLLYVSVVFMYLQVRSVVLCISKFAQQLQYNGKRHTYHQSNVSQLATYIIPQIKQSNISSAQAQFHQSFIVDKEFFSYDFKRLTLSSIIFIFQLFSSLLKQSSAWLAGLQLGGRQCCILMQSLEFESLEPLEPLESTSHLQFLRSGHLHWLLLSKGLRTCLILTFSMMAWASVLQKLFFLSAVWQLLRWAWVAAAFMPQSSCLAVISYILSGMLQFSLYFCYKFFLSVVSISISFCLAYNLWASDQRKPWYLSSSLYLRQRWDQGMLGYAEMGSLGMQQLVKGWGCRLEWQLGWRVLILLYNQMVALSCMFYFCSTILSTQSAYSSFAQLYSLCSLICVSVRHYLNLSLVFTLYY